MPIAITISKYFDVKKELETKRDLLLRALGYPEIKPFSSEERSLYEQIENFNENKRKCYLIYEACLQVIIYFERKLSFPIPLFVLKQTDKDKVFVLEDEDLESFIQFQHQYINYMQEIKKNPEVLRTQFIEAKLSSFENFKNDMLFMASQTVFFFESLLECIGISITKRDELGRIESIHYDD